MRNYPAETPVAFNVPMQDVGGTPLVATGYSYAVMNEMGVEIIPTTAVSVTGSPTSIALLIPADKNELAVDKTAGLRTIRSQITTANGVYTRLDRYTLTAEARLEVPRNSFQTYEEALVEATNVPNLTWGSMSDYDRQLGLMAAHERLIRNGYRVREPSEVDRFRYLDYTSGWSIKPHNWPVMTYEEWMIFPEDFRTAMRRAQIVEANVILSVDKIADRRRLGLLSETIGESSMMFRSGKPIDMGLSNMTMAYLSRYIDMRVTVTRS